MISYVLTFIAGMVFMVLVSGVAASLIMRGAAQMNRWEQ